MSILHTLFVLALLLVALVVYLVFRKRDTTINITDIKVTPVGDLGADVLVGVPGLDPRLVKKPRVLYYEDAIDGWTFMSDEQINHVLPLLGFDHVKDMLESESGKQHFEEVLRVKRVDMSDAEIDALPVD